MLYLTTAGPLISEDSGSPVSASGGVLEVCGLVPSSLRKKLGMFGPK